MAGEGLSVPNLVSSPVGAGGDPLALSPFMLDWIFGNRGSKELHIGGVCNARCSFCLLRANPFPIMEGSFRNLEDIKLQLCAMPVHDSPITLSSPHCGHVYAGEALLHPRLFEILELVRRKFRSNRLCFMTNGIVLEQQLFEKLAAFQPIEIMVSMHSARPEYWAKIFGKSERVAEKVIGSLRLFGQCGISLVGSIVVLPRVCGWGDLERTYEYFITHRAERMELFWPSYTSRTPETVVSNMAVSLEEFNEFSQRMSARFSTQIWMFPDILKPLSVRVEKIIAQTLMGNPKTGGGVYQHVVWLASRAAFEPLEKLVAEKAVSASNHHEVVPTENLTFGGNIIVSGLLTVDDFVRAGRRALEQWPETDVLLVPATGFDSLCRDLSGVPAYRIAESLGCPVWLVEDGGRIDGQLSRSILRQPAEWNQLSAPRRLAVRALRAGIRVLKKADAWFGNTAA